MFWDWPDEDQDMMRALDTYEAGLNAYGIPFEESTTSEADPANPRGTHYYDVDVIQDQAEAAVERVRKAWAENKNADTAGVRFVPRRVDRRTTQ